MPAREEVAAAIAEWDRPSLSAVLSAAEDQRRATLDAFPLASLPTLEIDRYALGTDVRESFCWYLEFGTPELGSIGVGNAMKHLIFNRANGDWYYPDGYPDVDAAWADLREQLALGIDAAGSGDFAALSGLPLFQNGSRTIAKAISIHHPDSILPVFARGHRDHYMRLLGSDQDGGEYAWDGCRRLLEVVRADHPEFDDWSPVEVMQFLYRRFSAIDTTTIVKIAPGSNADMWDDARDNGWVRVGWGGTGDLRSFASKEELVAAFGRVHACNGNQAKVTESRRGASEACR